MDIKSAFNNVSRSHLCQRMATLGVDPDLVRWTDSFMQDRRIRLEMEGRTGAEHSIESGIPQGSPVSPVLFAVYISEMFGYVEERADVKALSFVDDVAWWAEGRNETEVARKLTNAATYAVEWASENAVAFDVDKTEAMLLTRKHKIEWNTEIQVDGQTVKFNKQATRWLGIWIDSSLSLKDHHQAMMKKARNAQQRMRRLTGRMGLVPENVRRTQVACVQAVAMYGSELWWKGENENGTIGRANDLQILVNQQARDITGCFKSTNQGEPMPLSGLRPARPLLSYLGRQFALRMAFLPEGDQAGHPMGAPSEICKRLVTWLGDTGRHETTSLQEDILLKADVIVYDREAAKIAAQKPRPGLTLWADGSQ